MLCFILGIHRLVSFGFWDQQIPHTLRSACEIRHDLYLSPIPAPSPTPSQSLFWVYGASPFVWSQPISAGNSPAQQPWCLEQSNGLNKFCNRSCCLLLFLQPFAACLNQAPSLPGATQVAPFLRACVCSLHFLYTFILDMFRCPQIGIRHHFPKFCTQTSSRGTTLWIIILGTCSSSI